MLRVCASSGKPVGSPLSKTILIIEDDTVFLQQVCTVLRRAGHRVLSATNVSDAEEIWAMGRERIDIVLSDHVLGFDRGADLVQRFKTHQPETKIVLCSGSPVDFEHAGIEFLLKPFTASMLLAAAA